jgi:hypothetical protein
MNETTSANNEDPGPVKSSDAQRVTGNEANKESGDEPQRPARQDAPPGRTPTEDE